MQEQRGGTGRLGLSDRKREADEASEAGVAGPAPQACTTVFLGHTSPWIMLGNPGAPEHQAGMGAGQSV